VVINDIAPRAAKSASTWERVPVATMHAYCPLWRDICERQIGSSGARFRPSAVRSPRGVAVPSDR
jgi:hypothetical protein